MFTEKPKRKDIPINIKKKVFERAKGQCENPKCRKPLKWKNEGKGTIEGVFHHTGDPCRTPTSKTVRFLCPDCHHTSAHEYRTVKKELPFGGQKKERKVIRKSFITIRSKNVKSKQKMISYKCKLSVDQRTLYCGKKKASKACLKYTLSGTKCENLIRSL